MASFLFSPLSFAPYEQISWATFSNFTIAPPAPEMQSYQPILTSPTALVFDLESNTVIWERNKDWQKPMASLTKLMTALLILENHDLSEIVTVSPDATGIDGAKMWLWTGERITVEGLLHGLLIPSGNDAAIALAIFHSGSEAKFVQKMNERAYALNMQHTHFTNVHGFDAEGHYSSAADLSILAKKIWEYPIVQRIAATKSTEVSSVNGAIIHDLNNTNKLLGSAFPVIGLKTGTTEKAGQCLIAILEYGTRHIGIVVLGSTDRFFDTKALMAPFLQ